MNPHNSESVRKDVYDIARRYTDSSPVDDKTILDLDSLEAYSLIMDFSERFDIEISDSDGQRLVEMPHLDIGEHSKPHNASVTVGSLVNYFQENLFREEIGSGKQ